MSKIDFNVFAGSDTGFLKGIHLNKSSLISKNFGKDSVKNEGRQIVSLAWSSPAESEVIVGLQNQKTCIFDTEFNCYTWAHSHNLGEGPLISTFKKSDHFVTGLESGEIGILKGASNTIINTISKSKVSHNRSKKSTICAIQSNIHHPSQIASGGCENDLAIWDIQNSTAPVFKARNVSNDMLDLRVPIWISDLTYLPNSDQIALTTRHKHVRLYDPKAQRKPVINFEWEKNPLISIAAVPFAEKQILVGTDHGRMALFDLRNASSKTPVRAYRGFAGAVKSISVHESLPLIFSVSLDRYLRVHNLQNSEIIHKLFLKSRLTSVLVRKNLKEEDFLGSPEIESKKSKLSDTIEGLDAKRLKI